MINGFDINPDLSTRLQAYIESIQQQNFTISDLPEIQNSLMSESVLLQHHAIYAIRKMISIENAPPIQEILSLNLAPQIINIIDQSLTAWITHQGWWILTNLATGSTQQITILVQCGVIEIVIRQLNSSELKIVEQIVYFCGNLAADCQLFRDMLISKGAFSLIIRQFDKIKEKMESVQIFLLTISNIIRQRPTPDSSILIVIAPIISWSLVNYEFDQKTLQDIFWALTQVSDNNGTEFILSMENDRAKIMNMLIQYGNHQDLSLKLPCLRILGNLCSGDHEQTQLVIDFGFIPLVFQLLSDKSDIVKREACWALSNIAAGTSCQVSRIMNDSPLIENLFQLSKVGSKQVQKEINYIFTNLTEHGDLEEIFKISDALLQSFSDRLQQQDIQSSMVGCITEALQNIIQKNSVYQRQFIDKIKKFKLEKLLTKTSIYKTENSTMCKINKLLNDIEMKLFLEH